MTIRVNVHEAKSSLSQLLRRVEQGEEVVVARAGRPVARLVPYGGDRTPRNLGAWEGRLTVAEDFDETPEDVITAFEGSARTGRR